MQKRGSKYFSRRPQPPDPGLGSKLNFLEHGHTAYQIKGNGA